MAPSSAWGVSEREPLLEGAPRGRPPRGRAATIASAACWSGRFDGSSAGSPLARQAAAVHLVERDQRRAPHGRARVRRPSSVPSRSSIRMSAKRRACSRKRSPPARTRRAARARPSSRAGDPARSRPRGGPGAREPGAASEGRRSRRGHPAGPPRGPRPGGRTHPSRRAPPGSARRARQRPDAVAPDSRRRGREGRPVRADLDRMVADDARVVQELGARPAPVDLQSAGILSFDGADAVDAALDLRLGDLRRRAADAEPAAGVDDEQAAVGVFQHIGRMEVRCRSRRGSLRLEPERRPRRARRCAAGCGGG